MVEASPLIGRTSRISAATFTGRAVAPAQPDPVTTGLINKNSLQLAVVSSQIQGMSAQMNSLAGSLQVIASNLSTAQAIERQKEIQEQTLQAKLAEQKLREGKESVIEKKIQSATIAPAQKLASTAQFTLGRLGQFFTSLLGGWLLVKGVETLKALSEGNGKKLNEIKDNVLKNLALITGIFVGYKGGVALLTAAFSRVGTRLLAVAAAGLFVDPFNQFIKFIKEAAKDVVKQIPGLSNLIAPEEPEIDPGAPPTAENVKAGQGPEGGSNLEGKGGPSLSMPTETMTGQKVDPKLQELKNERAGIRQEFMSGRIGREEYKSQTAELTKQIDEFGSTNQAQVSAQPQQTVLGKPAEGENKKEAELDPATQAKYGETSLKAEVTMGFSADTSQSFVGTEKYTEKFAKLPADMFTPIKKDSGVDKKVGPAPEPPVNVVPIATGGQQAAPEPQPVASGGINNAPSFATSNRDNIYILGALSNFNVVPV